jgi:NAD(P)H-dependent FMN reductase
VKITAISGSMAPGSRTSQALACALRGAAEHNVETQLLELGDYELVFYGQVPPQEYPSDVARLREEVGAAQALIVGSPEYYGGMTGALKNALDLVGADELRGKIVGMVGIAGGASGAFNTLNAMRMIGRNLHCWVLPQEVSVANASQAIDPDGTINDQDIEERLLALGRQVAQFAVLQQRIRQDEFMQLWEGLPRW